MKQLRTLKVADTFWSLSGIFLKRKAYLPFYVNMATEAGVKIQFFTRINIQCDLELPDDENTSVWEALPGGGYRIWLFSNKKNLKWINGYLETGSDYQSFKVVYNMFSSLKRFDVVDALFFYAFQLNIVSRSGIILHAAAINYRDEGILFTAPSETGKSTQARLWNTNLGSQTINGDRPVLTVTEEEVLVHASPWSGSDRDVSLKSVPVKAIVVLEQHVENIVSRLKPKEAIGHLLPRCFAPFQDQWAMTQNLVTLEQVVNRVPIYLLRCRPDVDAVLTLQKELNLLGE